MIHEIAVELRAALVANGCPIPVVDGPEQMASVVVPRERIVVSRDRGQPEPVIAPKGAGRNPRHAFDRVLRAKVTIYAQDTRAGALHHEHARRADDIADDVLVALRQVLVARKNGVNEVGPGSTVDLEDAKGTAVTNFAAYEIPFAVRRAVEARTWAGAAKPEATIGEGNVTIASVPTVSIHGDTTPFNETGW